MTNDIIVVGAGLSGMLTSIILAALNIKTTLIEKQSFRTSNKLDLRNIAINPNTYNILANYNIWDKDILKARAVNDE